MNKIKIAQMATEILAREFANMNDDERRDYLRDHQDSRWNPGKSKLPRTKPRRKK